MSVTTTNFYGAYDNPGSVDITLYGVATDLYGVTTYPIVPVEERLLMETGDALLQENNGYILL
jgi:hypothetical protein